MSFAVILALMGAMATFSYTRLSRIDHFTTDVNTDSLAGLDYLHHIAVAVVTSDSLTREGLVASGAAAERLLKEIQSVRASLSTLAGRTGPVCHARRSAGMPAPARSSTSPAG